MIIQDIISQSKYVDLENQPDIIWEASDTGNYPDIGATKTTIFSPSSAGVNAYNHHSHCFEFYGKIYVMYSTANDDEEEPGQYVRYQTVQLDGTTYTSTQTLLESQDDITKGWSVAGRVCIPSAFAVVDGKLYAIVDINDKGASNSSRTGVGIIAVGINSNGTLDTPVWIENVNGTETAPSPISGYPSYAFDSVLRPKIRAFLSIPKFMPTWYFSVPTTDNLYTRDVYGGNAVSEPSTVTLISGQVLKLWRLLVGGSATKIAQTSNDGGQSWNDTYDTGIPDYPSRTKLLQFNNYDIGVIGNNDSVNRSPLFFAKSADGFYYASDDVYNIDTETNPPVYSGIYKDIGVQYPDAIELSNSKVFVAYSVNKEDIKVAIFDAP